MFYNARWYDPPLGRFAQADTIVPPSQGVQAWDRYAYTSNNPVRYNDPTGHNDACGIQAGGCGNEGPAEPTLVLDQSGISLAAAYNLSQETVVNGANNAWNFTVGIYSVFFEPVDWVNTASQCIGGECSAWMLLGLLPFIPSSLGKHADDAVTVMYHSSNPDNVSDLITNGFKTDLPVSTRIRSGRNNRLGFGIYLADTPVTALAESPGGQVLAVQVDLGKNLDITHLGVVDYDMGHSIARGAREHGFNSITYLSAKNPNGLNTIILNPSSILSVAPTSWDDPIWNLFK